MPQIVQVEIADLSNINQIQWVLLHTLGLMIELQKWSSVIVLLSKAEDISNKKLDCGCVYTYPHLWKELDKVLFIFLRPRTISDLDGNVSPLQRQLGSFSQTERTCFLVRGTFFFQVLARESHCDFLVSELGKVFAWAEKEAQEVEKTWRNLCGFYLAVNTQHWPIRSRLCKLWPIRAQVLPCEHSQRLVGGWLFNKVGQMNTFSGKLVHGLLFALLQYRHQECNILLLFCPRWKVNKVVNNRPFSNDLITHDCL